MTARTAAAILILGVVVSAVLDIVIHLTRQPKHRPKKDRHYE